MGYIRNNNVWKINKILAEISGGGVTPEDVQDMIDTSLTDYPDNTDLETALGGKQDTLTAGDGISIDNNVISASTVIPEDWELYTNTDWTVFKNENNELINDICIFIRFEDGYSDTVMFYPKGFKTNVGLNHGMSLKKGSFWFNLEYIQASLNAILVGTGQNVNVSGDGMQITINTSSGIITTSSILTSFALTRIYSLDNISNQSIALFVKKVQGDD